ncbi:MAG TPA: class II fructose-bisphosphate aldolase [candidate division Zixibacteria bacterium]|nr:class II fructose-bisphosphate aldolase [candidate division Zixibacteria bacterium]
MPLVGVKELLTEARAKQYGVPSLLGGNLEMVVGQISAAEQLRAPLIMTFTQEVTPKVPMELGMPLLVNAARRAKVPVATILDHGKSLEAVVRAILLGSSSVMFDGSTLSYEENVRQTKEVVRVAHAVGVDVEAELGRIAGSSIETGDVAMPMESSDNDSRDNMFTDPELALDFVERTGIDALAISFGNVHGLYVGEPNIDLDRVREIYSLVKVPLVMHGASGLADTEYQRIIKSGISKINYYSVMGRRATDDIRRLLVNPVQEGIVYHDIISRAIDFFREDTARVMRLMGCIGAV